MAELSEDTPRTEREEQLIAAFLDPHFPADFQPGPITEDEKAVGEAIINYVGERFTRMRYILGLAIDFTVLAQRLSQVDAEAKAFRPDLTADDLLTRYSRITERGETLANTLSLRYGGSEYGIRQTEEEVATLFNNLSRSGYPSAYVYNTGQWQKYRDLLELCFRLSESGRYMMARRLIKYGMDKLTENRFFGRETPRVRLFPLVITDYDRSRRRTENGGLIFQGIVFGFLTADRPHLDLVVDKVRTGSSRQRRFGDVDGYYGLDLELSAEVKDLHITALNFNNELGNFATNVAGGAVNGIAFAVTFDDEAREQLTAAGVTPVSQNEMLAQIGLWDWQKQDRAMQGVLHYLSHVEQNPDATNRLLAFIAEHDDKHSSLAYLIPSPEPEPPTSA